MENEFKGQSLFNDVPQVDVRAWNRCQVYLNLSCTQTAEAAREYVSNFDDIAKRHMRDMFERIRVNGLESTKKEIIKAV